MVVYIFKALLRIVGCCLIFVAASNGSGDTNSPVSVTLVPDKDKYVIVGKFISQADPQTAWSVLTDYDHLSKFVSSIRSHVRDEEGNILLVHQVASGGFLFFTASVEVLLKVH